MPFLFCLPGPAAQRAQDGSPIRRAKNARRAPRLIAPPAAPAAAPTAPAAPAAPAAGRPRAAKARAVWQPRRPRPCRKNTPVGRRAATHRPACRAAKNAWASRHAGRTAPPRHENSPVSRTPRAATHRPVCRAAAKKSGQPHAAPCRRRPQAAKARAVWQPHRAPPRHIILLLAARRDPSPQPRRKKSGRPRLNSGQPHGRAMPQAGRGPPKRAPYGSHTAPVPAAKYSCWPRAATHRPACRAAAKSPAKHPTGCTPSQNTRPPPIRAGARFRLSVSFLPLKMAAAHNRKGKRRTIAKTTARYGMGRSAARMVSGEHRKSRSARPQEPPRSRPRRPRRFSPPRPRPRWAPDAARPPRPPRACPRPRASGARPACSAR